MTIKATRYVPPYKTPLPSTLGFVSRPTPTFQPIAPCTLTLKLKETLAWGFPGFADGNFFLLNECFLFLHDFGAALSQYTIVESVL